MDRLSEMRPFPAVASRITASIDDPSIDAKQLETIIESDPAVALRLLRVANSAMYGFSREISSISHAIVVLGYRTVKDMCISIAAAGAFSEGKRAQRERESLLRHSLACGVIARQLATQLDNVDSAEAFLGGVVHDIGKLFFHDVVPDEYAQILPESGAAITSIEEQAFGMSHADAGERCSLDWGLPDSITEVIKCHHAPESASFEQQLVKVVALANFLDKSWKISNPAFEANDDDCAADVRGLLDGMDVEKTKARVASDFEAIRNACA